MWAHYADSHKGFCIEYDIPKLITYYQHPFSSVIEVKYSNNVPKIKPSLLSKKDILNVLQNINGRKSKAWEYEQEVRVIYDSAERIEIPSSAIKSIILGKKSTKENQERILKIAQIKGFSVFKSELVNKSYLIDKVPLYLTDGIRKRNNKIIPSNISYFNWSKFDKKEVSKLLWAATEKVAREDWVKSVDTVFYKRTDDDRDLVWINATPKKGITPVKQISYNRIELNQWVEKEPPKEEIDYIQKWLDNDN